MWSLHRKPFLFRIVQRGGVTNVLYTDIAASAVEHHLPVMISEGLMNDPALLDVVKGWGLMYKLLLVGTT
ncbi:hypothetical protein N8Z85_00790 [Porticoccus sp.]|nr:hypothetical protein [Porticoccus sp.]